FGIVSIGSILYYAMNLSSADVCKHLGSEWTNSSNVNTSENINKLDPYYSFADSIRTTPVPQT
ncbi:hypothetical protein COBT_003354, partial [Conglomerata obtusa]